MWGTVSLPTREENLWRAGTRGQPANQERALACSYLSRVNRSSAPHQGSLPGVPRSSTVPGTFEVALKTKTHFLGGGEGGHLGFLFPYSLGFPAVLERLIVLKPVLFLSCVIMDKLSQLRVKTSHCHTRKQFVCIRLDIVGFQRPFLFFSFSKIASESLLFGR